MSSGPLAARVLTQTQTHYIVHMFALTSLRMGHHPIPYTLPSCAWGITGGLDAGRRLHLDLLRRRTRGVVVGLRVVRAGRRGRLREVHRVAELLALAAVRPAAARRAPWSLRLARPALQLRSVDGTQFLQTFRPAKHTGPGREAETRNVQSIVKSYKA